MAARQRVADHYTPKIAAALTAAFPGIVRSARGAANGYRQATKAADPTITASPVPLDNATASFRAQNPPDTGSLATTLTAMHLDAWVAALEVAADHPKLSDAAARLLPDVPDDWVPGWAETADLETPLPPALQQLVGASDETAGKIAGGLLKRASSALEGGLSDDSSVGAVGSLVRDTINDPSYATEVAVTETAVSAETATIACYQASNVAQWDWVPDPDACDRCVAKGAGGPYGPGDGTPPLHNGCKCVTAPHEED